MKIQEIQIVKTTSGQALARIDIHFEGFVLKGFKLFEQPTTGQYYITPPSYLSKQGWRPLFKTDSLKDWQVISEQTITAYKKLELEEFKEDNGISIEE